ncbi:MAG: ABC-2 family transporter protein [Tetrasphaera sp.]
MTTLPLLGRRTSRLARTYAALLRVEAQAASAYRWELVLSAFAWIVPLAFLALWSSAAADGPAGGITRTQFATYYCLLLFTTSLQVTMPVIFEFGWQVYSGQLSAQLLRPVHPMHQIVARAAAAKLYGLPPMLLVVPIALWLTGARVQTGPDDWLLAAIVSLLGTAALVHLAAMSAAIAFWMTKAQGVQGLLLGVEWVIGGLVAPVALLPGLLPDIAVHQPLWFANGAAPEILSGIGDRGWWLAGEALVWLVSLHAAYRLIWRAGLRRYEAVGTWANCCARSALSPTAGARSSAPRPSTGRT